MATSVEGSSKEESISEDSDSLRGIDLDCEVTIDVLLPNGTLHQLPIVASTPWGDFRTQLFSRYKLSPSSHVINLDSSSSSSVKRKASCPIGKMSISCVKIQEKNSSANSDAMSRPTTGSGENTVRLIVRVARMRQIVLRVHPDAPLLSVFDLVCEKQQIDDEAKRRYEFRHPSMPDTQLDVNHSLNHYQLRELALVEKQAKPSKPSHAKAPPPPPARTKRKAPAPPPPHVEQPRVNPSQNTTSDVDPEDKSLKAPKTAKRRAAPPPPPRRHHTPVASSDRERKSDEEIELDRTAPQVDDASSAQDDSSSLASQSHPSSTNQETPVESVCEKDESDVILCRPPLGQKLSGTDDDALTVSVTTSDVTDAANADDVIGDEITKESNVDTSSPNENGDITTQVPSEQNDNPASAYDASVGTESAENLNISSSDEDLKIESVTVQSPDDVLHELDDVISGVDDVERENTHEAQQCGLRFGDIIVYDVDDEEEPRDLEARREFEDLPPDDPIELLPPPPVELLQDPAKHSEETESSSHQQLPTTPDDDHTVHENNAANEDSSSISQHVSSPTTESPLLTDPVTSQAVRDVPSHERSQVDVEQQDEVPVHVEEISFASQPESSRESKQDKDESHFTPKPEMSESEKTALEIERLHLQIRQMRRRSSLNASSHSNQQGWQRGSNSFTFIPNKAHLNTHSDYEVAPVEGIELSGNGEIKSLHQQNDHKEPRSPTRIRDSVKSPTMLPSYYKKFLGMKSYSAAGNAN